jgi:glutaredoxin
MELYQAEWCPHSHRVRQRMTELGVLLVEDGTAVCGDEAILRYLDRFPERADAAEHRAKAREEVKQFAELRAA